jgi:cell shape-determining protein MreD
MILKIFRSLWFVSLLAVLASLLLVYASLQQTVVVQEEGIHQVRLTRDVFFYTVLAALTLINAMVYLIKKFYLKDETFRSWFHGLIITINIFFIVALSLISSFNSGERFDFSRIGFVVYGSVALIVIWAFAWPVLHFYRRLSSKSTV